MRDSILFSSVRSFFVAACAVVGVGMGFGALIILVALISTSTGQESITTLYKAEILPNANNVRKELSKEAPVLLQLNIHGVIGMDSLTTAGVRQQLIESREGIFENNRVKGILLHINTPGGTMDDSDGIYRLLKAYKEQYKVPVYVYVDGMCASGGMYIACAADKIYATDVSLIGSVGVLTPSFMNFSQLLEKVGVQALTLTAGKGKDEMNPLRPWKPGEQDSYQFIINYYYQSFLSVVTGARPRLTKEKLVEDYGAHIFPAVIAQEHGYIDESGKTFAEVQKALLQQLGIEGDYYQVIQLQNTNWVAELFKSQFSLLSGKMTHEVRLSSELPPELMNKFLYMYHPQ
jgi:protease IV